MRYFYKVLTPLGHKWIGVAERKLAEYERQRQAQKRTVFKKVTHLGDVLCLFHLTDQVKYFVIFGGGSGQILFSVPGDVTQTWAYDYLTDSLGQAINFEANVSGALHPFANGECHLGEQRYARLSGAVWSGGALDPALTELAVEPAYELEVLRDETLLHARVGGNTAAVAALPVQTNWQWEDALAEAMGGSIYLPGRYTALNWNLFTPIDAWAFLPAARALQSGWYWIPSFFFAEPGNGLFATGWHYGHKDGGWYFTDPLAPLTYGRATFGGFMECKHPGGLTPVGYCETLIKAEDTYPYVACFFLASSLPAPGNPTFVYASQTGMKYAGSDLSGHNPTFRINVKDYLPGLVDGSDPDISFWSYKGFVSESAPLVHDPVGVVLRDGLNATVIRYAGYEQVVVQTTKYHSHSTNFDGSIFCLFETEDGTTISNIKVYDFFGGSGGAVLLRDSAKVASLQATSACHVPLRSQKLRDREITEVLPTALPYTLSAETVPITITAEDTQKWYAPLGVIHYPDFAFGNNASATIWKMTCDDGIHGEVRVYQDACFESVVQHVRANGPLDHVDVTFDGETYIGPFEGLVNALPKILSFTTELPYEVLLVSSFTKRSNTEMTFQGGVPSGSGFTITPWTLSDTITIGRCLPDNDICWSGSLGTLTFGGCFNDDGTEDLDCPPNCDGTKTFTMTSSCGQSGEYSETVTPAALVVSGDEDCSVGDIYSASGGISPYVFSFDGGTINATTGEVTAINACGASGSARWATITVTDSCGNTAKLEVRLPNGTWVIISTCGSVNDNDTSFGNLRSGLSSCETPMADFNWHGCTRDSLSTTGRVSNYENYTYDGGYRYFPQFKAGADGEYCTQASGTCHSIAQPWDGNNGGISGSVSSTTLVGCCGDDIVSGSGYRYIDPGCWAIDYSVCLRYLQVSEWRCP